MEKQWLNRKLSRAVNKKQWELKRWGKHTKGLWAGNSGRDKTSSTINRDKGTIKALVLEQTKTLPWQWRETTAIFWNWTEWWWTAATGSGAATSFLPQWEWQRGKWRDEEWREPKHSSGLQFWVFQPLNATILNRFCTLQHRWHVNYLIISYLQHVLSSVLVSPQGWR